MYIDEIEEYKNKVKELEEGKAVASKQDLTDSLAEIKSLSTLTENLQSKIEEELRNNGEEEESQMELDLFNEVKGDFLMKKEKRTENIALFINKEKENQKSQNKEFSLQCIQEDGEELTEEQIHQMQELFEQIKVLNETTKIVAEQIFAQSETVAKVDEIVDVTKEDIHEGLGELNEGKKIQRESLASNIKRNLFFWKK